MNIKILTRLRKATLAAAFAGAVFLFAPGIPASVVHAEGCTHENYDWVTLIKPTCSKQGRDIKICQDCEAVLETEYTEKTEHKGKWERTKEPTCTLPGTRSYLCKNCGTEIESEEIPAKGHKFKRGGTTRATCACEGTKTSVCKMCGATKTESIPRTDKHKYGNWSIKSAVVNGKKIEITESRTCKVCKEDCKIIKGTTPAFSKIHDRRHYYYKLTKGSGRIMILCADCHE